MKRIILLFVVLVEIFLANNTCLTATETPVAQSVDFSNAVQTIEINDAENIESESVIAEISAPRADIAEDIYYAPALNYINIAGRTINIENVDSTAVNAGDHVNKFGNFLYGHNSYSVFGSLNTLSEGETFVVALDGVSQTYIIKRIVLYEKVSQTLLHEVGADSNLSMSFVARAKTSAKADPYDLSIMTCAGTSYGNGDASHRLVLFADKI